MVASSNIAGPNLDTYYSSVISLCSMCTIIFLSELNNIDTCTCEISNAYLTASTTQKIEFNDGPEFATFWHAGHFLLINTTLYGLKISVDRFHYRL